MRLFQFFGIAIAAFAAVPAYADYVKPHVDQTRPHPDPAYPTQALAAGEEGTVVLRLHISPSGKIIRFKIKQSSGFDDIDSAAVLAALNWHYVPAIWDGSTRTDDMDLAIQFKLPPPH